MAHLPSTRWHGYETEPRRVEITVASGLSVADIASAELRIDGEEAVTLTIDTAVGGYLLFADPVVLPAAGQYRWSAEVADTDGNAPIVVATGSLNVGARVDVAA